MPTELSARGLGRRLLEVATLVGAVVTVVLAGPGLGDLRRQLSRTSGAWLGVAVGLELLSALSYVVVFRAVFCPRMSWRLSYQIGMAEQGANSVLSVSGAGGLALGAWALRRGGMSSDQIARRSVAFFFLTSLANVGTLIVVAALSLGGVIGPDTDPGLTAGFGAAAVLATGIVLMLPRLLRRPSGRSASDRAGGRLGAALRFVRDSMGDGVIDALMLMRRRPIGVLVGSFGFMGFDVAVLGICFAALGFRPPLAVLILGYLIGQLGGNIPVPAGIGGVDAGLIGTFVLYRQPVAATSAGVLVYHAIALWVPALLGSVAFVQLRRILARHDQPAVLCAPLVEPVTVPPPAAAGRVS